MSDTARQAGPDAELRRVVRLLVEALSPDGDPSGTTGRLMSGLARLADADAWLCFRSHEHPDGSGRRSFDHRFGGVFSEGLLRGGNENTDVPTPHWAGHPEPALAVLEGYAAILRGRPETGPRDVCRTGRCDRVLLAEGLGFFLCSTLADRNPGSGLVSASQTAMLFRRPGSKPFDRDAAERFHLIFGEYGRVTPIAAAQPIAS